MKFKLSDILMLPHQKAIGFDGISRFTVYLLTQEPSRQMNSSLQFEEINSMDIILFQKPSKWAQPVLLLNADGQKQIRR